MMLVRALWRYRLATTKTKKTEDTLRRGSAKVYYDMPVFLTGGRNQFRINERCPPDAEEFPLESLRIYNYQDTPDFDKIPKLQHGLHKLLDGKIHMGDMGFGKFPQVTPEMISEMSDYKSPSEDMRLLQISKDAKCKYFSSTSNVSVALYHLYYILSMFRRPNFDNIYEQNHKIKKQLMNHFKKPATFFLKRKGDNSYSIDSDKGYSEERTNQVLLQVGTYGEYLLTNTAETIRKMIMTGKVDKKPESYFRYCSVNNDLLLRSQIDCREMDRMGNQFVFQIKTRACCPIRYDVENWQDYKDYPIDKIRGDLESFQRQYYDLVRGAFMKYAFQLKIGRMDGAFVAYHNTQSVYGYEYVPFKEMIMRLFGDEYNLDVSFTVTSKMLTSILNYVLEDLKSYSFEQLKIGFYANSVTKSLNVMVEVMSEVKEYPSVASMGVSQYFRVHISELKNPVYKYDFCFYAFLNNILVRHPSIYFTPEDNLRMKWQVKKLGRVQREEYILFLKEAYKEDFSFGTPRYYGNWGETSQIKEWS